MLMVLGVVRRVTLCAVDNEILIKWCRIVMFAESFIGNLVFYFQVVFWHGDSSPRARVASHPNGVEYDLTPPDDKKNPENVV